MIQFRNRKNEIVRIDENKEIARGGEGRIILLPKNKGVAKIFHKPYDLDLLQHFDYLMNWDNHNFLLPSDILTSKKGLAGYIMPFLDDIYQPVSVLFSKNFCRKKGIDISLKLSLIENLAKALDEAHQQKIIIGDFNPYNIMLNTKDFSFKIIDTDSFQSPFHLHSGVLLEDVRDYFKDGIVNQQSDFFALSVLAFYMLGFAHPFKGIHPKFKSLRNRMLNKLPIYADGVKRPKCFEPLAADFMSVFDDFYLAGKRYLFHLRLAKQPMVQKSGFVEQVLDSKIKVQPIFTGNYIDSDFNSRWGFISDSKSWFLYESVEKGKLVLRKTFPKSDFDTFFLAENTVLATKDKQWFWGIEKKAEPIKNLNFGAEDRFVQYGNILTIISEGTLYKLYMNEIVYNNIRLERIEVFEHGFKRNQSWVMLSGGQNHIFYNFKGNLSSLRLNRNIISVFQRANYGIYTFKENNQLKQRFFKLSGLNIYEYTQELDEYFNFDTLQNDFLIVARDDEIEIRNASNLSVLAKYPLKEASADSLLYSSNAGIVLCSENGVFLVNKENDNK